jgi:hypothetical protein
MLGRANLPFPSDHDAKASQRPHIYSLDSYFLLLDRLLLQEYARKANSSQPKSAPDVRISSAGAGAIVTAYIL